MARPRAIDYDDKRLAILARSAELFAERGYPRTTMSEIAEACGISKGLFYHYYASKEALLYDMLASHLGRLADAVAGADQRALAPQLRLKRMVAAVLTVYEDADALHKVQMNDLGILPAAQQDELRTIEREVVERFAAALVEINPALGSGRRLLKPVTMSLFGMMNWHHTWFRPDGALTREGYADLAVAMIVAGAGALENDSPAHTQVGRAPKR